MTDTGVTTDGLRRRRRLAEAAHAGTAEVARPVMAATLTTIAVFFPVVYVRGSPVRSSGTRRSA